MQQNKLIVFEGIDGSGKTTQINLLIKYLLSKKLPHKIISFPQYGKNDFAKKIKDYLEGKLGKIGEVDPYFIAKEYASDRLTAKDMINSWLNAGKLVIANRYVSSSKAHLGANLSDEKRTDFFDWVDKLEYEENGMSRPNLTILLKVDPKVGQENARKDHLVDIHEQNLDHEQKASKIFLELAQKEKNWMTINCMENATMKSEEDTNKEIIEILKSKLF